MLPNRDHAEFYAGIGIISLTLADQCQSATLVEINPFAEACLKEGLPPSHFHFFTGPTENYLDQLKEVLIVDPLRKGLDPKALNAIKDSSLYRNNLKKDLEVLKSSGWIFQQAKGYHLFPNTNHVELLVDLRKNLST